MIEMDRVRTLRHLRQVCVLGMLLCIGAIVAPTPMFAYSLLALFAVYFFLRVLDYSVKLYEHQLQIDDLPLRRRDRMP